MLTALIALAVAPSAFGNTYVVTKTADTNGVCVPGDCSLREAINVANGRPGPDVIEFSIGFGTQTIQPVSQLPTITDDVLVDGLSQPFDGEGEPPIELDGSLAGDGVDGFVIEADNVHLRGFAINRFQTDLTGAGGRGIVIVAGQDNRVSGTYVGLDLSGTVDFGNESDGVAVLADGNRVGESQIAGNGGNGVYVASSGSQIRGNNIGKIVFGIDPYTIFNDGYGVRVVGDDNRIGADSGNDIIVNTLGGVRIAGNDNLVTSNTINDNGAFTTGVFVESGTGNRISANSMDNNVGLGIDLAPDSVTPNDPGGDGDAGANGLQNFPVLTSATSRGAEDKLTIKGSIDSAPEGTYTIEFFTVSSCDGSGFGEGQTFLGDVVTRNGSFTGTFDITGLANFVTATATDGAGNTSEFSECEPIVTAGATYVVDTNIDANLTACTAAAADCSFRGAINKANGAPGLDRIEFNISGGTGGYFTIVVNGTGNGALPAITDPVDIDGNTEAPPFPDPFPGAPRIALDLTAEPSGLAGLRLMAGGSSVRGLVINNYVASGVLINGYSDNLLSYNYIGTGFSGTADLGGTNGVEIVDSSSNEIGQIFDVRQVVSGNSNAGVLIDGEGTSTANLVEGNFIGTNASGDAAIPNATGILVDGQSGNQIGTGEFYYLGTTNLISGNTGAAVRLVGAADNSLEGNLIGTKLDATGALPNGTGVLIDNGSSGNMIGRASPFGFDFNQDANLIVHNGTGIELTGGAHDNVIAGNHIGTDSAGTADLGNASYGVYIHDSTGNTIGPRNRVAFNEAAGVYVQLADDIENWITENSIHDNGGLGIDLGALGPDGYSGMPDMPILASAASGTGETEITGSQPTEAGKTYRIEFYSNPVGDGSGFGEGKTFLGFTEVAGTGGSVPFSFVHEGNVPKDYAITATATDWTSSGSTSEFSEGVAVSEPTTFVVDTVDDDGSLDACTDDPLDCSLRGAISNANAAPGLNRIHFDVGAGYNQTIFVGTPGLPAITGQTIIDGNTQPGSDPFFPVPLIELAGGFSEGSSGIVVSGAAASDTVIRGLIVNSFGDGSGIVVQSAASEVKIEGNYIGTDSSGNYDFGNTFHGVVVSGADQTTIGGSGFGQRNLISGNDSDGVHVDGGSSATTIVGNFVGTDSFTGSAVGNGNGVFVGAATGTQIGNGTEVGRNVVSGNAQNGIVLQSPTSVLGNYIGTDSAGFFDLGNELRGIRIEGSDSLIGGAAEEKRNVISGNQAGGVELIGVGATENIVEGNYIGTTASGESVLGNDGVPGVSAGVYLEGGASFNSVGTESEYGAGNVIAGSDVGVWVAAASDTIIQGNRIGTDPLGQDALPNTNGVVTTSGASATTVGGFTALARNVISGNDADGIHDDGDGTQILGNYIGTNATGDGGLGNGARGIQATGTDTVIGTSGARNVISANGFMGVHVHDTTGVQIIANYIGTDATGEVGLGNAGAGVNIHGVPGATVGGGEGGGNVISDNTVGISVTGFAEGTRTIQYNLIGTDADGEEALGNSAVGVDVDLGASGVQIGGTSAGAGNVISDHGNGIEMTGGSGATIEGNLIGTDLAGEVDLGNAGNGILVSGAGTVATIGGDVDPASRNVISGNGVGVSLQSGGHAIIEGNYIGTNSAGTQRLGNGTGVSLGTSGNTLGGTAAEAGNLISGNTDYGVTVNATGNDIHGNYIGTNAAGTASLYNGRIGVLVSTSNVVVGGSDPGEGNVISGQNNTDLQANPAGVSIGGGSFTNVRIEGNYIGTNVAGTAAVPNSRGVSISGNGGHTVGGNSAGARNIISGNSAYGVQISNAGATGNVVQGNYIGTNAAGTAAVGNSVGVGISSAPTNTVGGSSATVRNIISGNNTGVFIQQVAATGNVVQGNYVGLDANGAALGNVNGIQIGGGATATIGGLAAPLGSAPGNVISNNTSNGILIQGTGSSATIQGNLVGTDASGAADHGNVASGIRIESAGSTVGGTAAGAGNLISGNNGPGVLISGSGGTGNSVLGNLIGTDLAGTSALSNANGVTVAGGSSNTIGGTTAAARNVISANGQGVRLISGATNNTVQGNLVGLTADGNPLGNNGTGVFILDSSNTQVGGTAAGAGNTIAHNAANVPEGVFSSGVMVVGPSSTGNSIRRNSIHSNGDEAGHLGIDLGGDGVTPNDPEDADASPNHLQNFPLITSAQVAPNNEETVIEGELEDELWSGQPSGDDYVLEFFANVECDTSGNGEGKTFLGSVTITENDEIDVGPEPFTFVYDGVLESGVPVTATATDEGGDTSEFSPCFEVTSGAPADATISLGSTQSSVIAGAQSVPISGISLSELTEGSGGTTQSTPLDGIPLDGIPLDGIDLAASPLDGIPLDGIGLTPSLLNEALGGVLLSEIQISGGWEPVLAGTALEGVPLQTITLADVFALPSSPLSNVTLGQIDLSATPLDGIPLAGLALGPRLLSEIPLNPAPPNDAAANLADWCAEMNEEPGYPCSSPASLQGETLVGVTIKGLPLDGIPLDGIPLDGIPLDGIPLDGIPLDGIDLTGTPLDGIPLDGIDFAASPLDGIPLDGIDITGSPLDGIPLDGILLAGSPLDGIPLDGIPVSTRDQIVDCTGGYDCSGKTLGQAHDDGRLKAGAKLGHLAGELEGFTLGDLLFYDDVTLGQLVDALLGSFGLSLADLAAGLPEPPERTLRDLLAVLLGEVGYDWSDLSLTTFPIAEHSPDGGVITYQATFTVTGGSSPTTATIHATVPEGGIYRDLSTTLVETASATAVPLSEPTLTGSQLEWEAEVETGVEYRLTWQVHAPIELGDYAVAANVIVPGMAAAALSSPVSVEVTQTLEPNNPPGAGPELSADTLYFSYMLQGDVDRYVVPIPAAYGSRVEITLSHIAEGTDLDLTVAGPPAPRLRAAPLDGIPLQNQQLPDTPVDLNERGQALPPETLQDVPVDELTAGGNVIRATSDNRGNADEHVRLISQGQTGNYLVQVSDYQGDSDMPYMLEVEVSGPPDLGPCASRTFANAGEGVAGVIPSVPADVNTLILVNKKRLGDTYGAAAANDMMAKLNQLANASSLGVVGAVIPVDGDPGVAAAYNAWDANPCSPALANGVVREIGELIDAIEPANLQYKVLVGGDDQIPFGRVPDETEIANQLGHADELGDENNQYKGAAGHGFLMTDDVYAEEAAPQLLGHELFVPDQAIGRLVEEPGEMTGMIDAFLAANGAVAPQRSLVTGYDFLTDGAEAVNAPFTARYGPTNTAELINETWNATDLDNALFPATNAPQIASVNAHFDEHRSLPAAENLAQRAANLYTTQHVLSHGANAVAQRVLFSMGCHSGLALSNQIYGPSSPRRQDWAQTFLAAGAFAWIGNSGYGLGDTVAPAYSERLAALFASNLDGSLSLGEALADAKNDYLAELAVIDAYHAKVVMESTLYGLPMLDVGSGAAPTNPPPLPTQTDPATGLVAASFNSTPTFTPVITDDGKYYKAETTQTTNRRPIQPAVSFDVTQPGQIAHGVVITSLHALADEAPFDSAYSRVVIDDSDDEPELVGEASYPSKIQSLANFSSFASPATTRQRVILITGLFRSDGVPDPEGIGIQRLYDQIGGYVLYAPPSETDFVPPSLKGFETQNVGTGMGWAVTATDAAGTVEDVKLIYRDCAGTWRLSNGQPSGGDRWSGGGPLAPTTTCTTSEIDYYLQAVDDAGNVAVSSKKVQLEPLSLPPATGDTEITFTLSGPFHSQSGFYTGDVHVEISPTAGMQYSVDGGAFQDYPAGGFTVGGDGVHFVEAEAADASTRTTGFAIDTSNPTVLMRTPPPGAVYRLGQTVFADYECADAGSGVASCSGSTPDGAPLDTATLGKKTITVTATDVVGHTTNFSRDYTVALPDILFTSNRTGNGDIYAIPEGGGDPVQLTSGAAIDSEPEWSPDRKRIVFSSNRDGNFELYVMNADGSGVTRLTNNPAWDTSATFSPNGLKIAWASNRGSGGNWDIYSMNADGTGVVSRLTTHKDVDRLPTWSPTGGEIGFMSERTGNGDIYTMNANGTSQTRRTASSGTDSDPAWFGATIAFSTNRNGESNFEIYTMTSTGAFQTRRTNSAGHDVTPAWSFDGTKLVFASNRTPPGGGVNFNIFMTTLNLDGSFQTPTPLVVHPAIDTAPDW